MNKAFYKLDNHLMFYSNCDGFQTGCEKLNIIRFALNPIEYFFPKIDRYIQENIITLSSEDSYRKRPDIIFKTAQEEEAFNEAYWDYLGKRWYDMPKIEMSIEDYNALVVKWKKIREEKPTFIVFSLDDSGLLDIVDVIGKHELSPQELQDMQADHEQYLLWQKAELLYNGDHEIVDDIWRSPADSVFDVDIAKYVGRSQGFVERKVYTKADVIAELQNKLKQLEPTYLIVHWLRIRDCYGVTESDPMFDELLRNFSLMDSYPEDMISREKLQDIADRLSLGQDVALPD